jgi:hypothetical protein
MLYDKQAMNKAIDKFFMDFKEMKEVTDKVKGADNIKDTIYKSFRLDNRDNIFVINNGRLVVSDKKLMKLIQMVNPDDDIDELFKDVIDTDSEPVGVYIFKCNRILRDNDRLRDGLAEQIKSGVVLLNGVEFIEYIGEDAGEDLLMIHVG